jgi:uncharacterized protein (DUF58 family)
MLPRLQINSYILPILALAALVMQLIDPSRIWSAALTALGGALVISYFWARSLVKGLHLVREMRFGWAQVGDQLEERFTVTNDGVFPATWMEVEDHSTLPDYNASLATGVDGNSNNQWYKNGVCTRRGLYMLGSTTLKSGDPLGIFTVILEDPARATLMVMPPVVPLPQLQITPGGYSGEGHPIPNAPEHTVGANGVREYTPGDSLRLIHWPTTARQQKPFVRLFDGAPAGDWWILLDLDEATQFGSGADSTEEHGVILAASLADRGLRARQSVGLVANGDSLTWIPAKQNENQRWEILRALALTKPGKTPLAELLERVRPTIGRHASLMLITASTRVDWLSALIPLQWRNIIPTVLLLDSQSFGYQQGTEQVAVALREMGVAHHIITRDLLDRPEARPGRQGQWEWRYSPTGRAILISAPEQIMWRRLSP